jgi:hypothetical protein
MSGHRLSGDITHLATTCRRVGLRTRVKTAGHRTPLRFVSPRRCRPGKPCRPCLRRLSPAPTAASLVLLPHAGRRALCYSAFGPSLKHRGESCRLVLVGKLQCLRVQRCSVTLSAPPLCYYAPTPLSSLCAGHRSSPFSSPPLRRSCCVVA